MNSCKYWRAGLRTDDITWGWMIYIGGLLRPELYAETTVAAAVAVVVFSAPCVVHQLQSNDRVDGVTSLDDHLFVLLSDRIDVHNTCSDYTRSQQHIALPGLRGHKWNDLTSCRRNRCVYVSDCDGSCVRRLALDGQETKWTLTDRPRGLSVKPADGNLLVTCVGARKLIELSQLGEVLRNITLQQVWANQPTVHTCNYCNCCLSVQCRIGQNKKCILTLTGIQNTTKISTKKWVGISRKDAKAYSTHIRLKCIIKIFKNIKNQLKLIWV